MIKKTILILLLILSGTYSYAQESSIELPLIGDRLSGAVSETEEEALGRQFLRDLKRFIIIQKKLILFNGFQI